MDLELTASRVAVVVVHLQGHIAGTGAFAPVFAEQIAERGLVAAVDRLLTASRSAGAQVVYARIAWRPDYADLVANSPLLQMAQQAHALTEGDPLTEILPEVAPHEGDLVHTHVRMGPFTPDLDERLRSRGIDTIAVVGVATNASVEAAARQASDAGYRVLVIEDCCSAGTPEAHAASIASMGLVGQVVDSATFVAGVQGPRGG